MTFNSKIRPGSPAALPPFWSTLRNLVARVVRRPCASHRLELLETLPLGGKRQLLLVTCDGRSYLIGAGADSVSAIVPAGNGADISVVSADLLNCTGSDSTKEESLPQ